MREIHFGHTGKARVWDTELSPYASYDSVHTKIIEARARPSTGTAIRLGAVDWRRFSGRYDHAMLGGQFVPTAGTQWRAIVPIADDYGPIIGDTVFGDSKHERTHIGLANEYFRGIELAARDLEAEPNGLLAGTVTVSRAAHGEVASSVASFRLVMTCLVRMLQLEAGSLSDDALRAMFAAPFRR